MMFQNHKATSFKVKKPFKNSSSWISFTFLVDYTFILWTEPNKTIRIIKTDTSMIFFWFKTEIKYYYCGLRFQQKKVITILVSFSFGPVRTIFIDSKWRYHKFHIRKKRWPILDNSLLGLILNWPFYYFHFEILKTF